MKKVRSINIFIFCLGLVATFMVLFPCLINDATNDVYTGIQILTKTVISDSDSTYVVRFNPDVFTYIAYIFPTIAGFFTIFFNNKIVTTISSIMFGISTVLLFSLPININVIITFLNGSTDYYSTWSYAGGLLIAGSLTLLATFLNFRKLEIIDKIK